MRRCDAMTTPRERHLRDVFARYEAAVKLLPELPAVAQRWALLAAVLAPKDARLHNLPEREGRRSSAHNRRPAAHAA